MAEHCRRPDGFDRLLGCSAGGRYVAPTLEPPVGKSGPTFSCTLQLATRGQRCCDGAPRTWGEASAAGPCSARTGCTFYHLAEAFPGGPVLGKPRAT